MKGFISLLDFSTDELIEILNRADKLHDLWHNNKMPQSLKYKKIGLWFFGQGFRNRVAFEIGAKSMGAIVSYIPGEIGIHEPLEDIGHYLKKVLFLSCPPVTRCEEVSNDAMNSDLCLNFAAKEFLLHSQNAIMEMV